MKGPALAKGLHHRNLTNQDLQQHLASGLYSDKDECEEVDLSHNRLESIDSTLNIWHVSENTYKLILSHNLIKSISNPSVILAKLRVLDMAFNCISMLPDDIFSWTPRLQRLRLECNQLLVLPSSIVRLKWLEVLSIGSEFGGNLVNKLPDGMENLANLRVFLASHNRLARFPSELIKCPFLERLVVDHNCINQMPTINSIRASKLEEINLGNNQISAIEEQIVLPESIRVLDLSNNRIEYIDESFLDPLPHNCILLLVGNQASEQFLNNRQAQASLKPKISFPSLLELSARVKLNSKCTILSKAIATTTTPIIDHYLDSTIKICSNCPLRFIAGGSQILRKDIIPGRPDLFCRMQCCSSSCFESICIRKQEDKKQSLITSDSMGNLVLSAKDLIDAEF